METKDSIKQLRRQLNMSQKEFAAAISVTRQAVSRWECGEVVPSTDTLKLISDTFGVPVDCLLGMETPLCQSCGAALTRERDRGTESDGSPAADYCAFCYQNGRFTQDLTIEEIIEHNLAGLESWNRENGLKLSIEEARGQLREFLPTLKRWRE